MLYSLGHGHTERNGAFYVLPTDTAVEVRVTATTVDVLLRGVRVWLHVRSYQPGRHTTIPDPYAEDASRASGVKSLPLDRLGCRIGQHTEALVQALLESRPHPE